MLCLQRQYFQYQKNNVLCGTFVFGPSSSDFDHSLECILRRLVYLLMAFLKCQQALGPIIRWCCLQRPLDKSQLLLFLL